MKSARRHLIWFGQAPLPQTELACNERNLILSIGTTPTAAATWASSGGAVFVLPAGDDGQNFKLQWKNELHQALCHGLRIIILADLEKIPSVNKFISALCMDIEPWARNCEKDIPETIARYEPGPSWSGVVEIHCDSSLDEEKMLLIRRAFGDCISVKLVTQTEGRSAQVFCGYARLKDSRAGPLPLPFFVKLDKAHKIERELKNYRECTTLFIPFNQRPNLDPDRCAMGYSRGVIVGNFVEESVPLRKLVELGTARQAIHSLFSGALRGWRSQAYFDEPNTIRTSLVDSLVLCLPSRYSAGRRKALESNAKGAEALGAKTSPEKLEELFRRLPGHPHRCALMHGDLHGENVRVSGTEAILIDFTSVGPGPLVADPAALDVALVVGANNIDSGVWKEFAQQCYNIEHLLTCPPPADPTEPAAALWNSIRLIRHIGLADQMSPFEYATAVGMYLLRYASCRPDKNEDPVRRQIAYLLAEQLAEVLVDKTTILCPAKTAPLPLISTNLR